MTSSWLVQKLLIVFQLLRDEPTLIVQLANCLGSQYLASASGRLYAALIKGLTLETWTEWLLVPFVTALISENRLIRFVSQLLKCSRSLFFPWVLTDNLLENLIHSGIRAWPIYQPRINYHEPSVWIIRLSLPAVMGSVYDLVLDNSTIECVEL